MNRPDFRKTATEERGEMITNQVQKIETLTGQLDEFKHYENLFGDPRAVVLTTVQPS